MKETEVIIHGIHKVRSKEPCFLVEISIHNNKEEFQIINLGFDAKTPWGIREQAAFEVHYLTDDGSSILGNHTYKWDNPDLHKKEGLRLAFLMFYIEPGGILKTQYGNVTFPNPTTKPTRLKSIKYKSPY